MHDQAAFVTDEFCRQIWDLLEPSFSGTGFASWLKWKLDAGWSEEEILEAAREEAARQARSRLGVLDSAA
jgi:hypothetical protein